MKKILIGTNNSGKVKEIKNIFNDKEFEFITLKDINKEIHIEENGETFEENAKKKAKEISILTNMPCITDDSGICIEKFGGWPGVKTDRFLGVNATSEEKNNYIIEKMKELKDDERNVKFICVIAFYENGKFKVTKGGVEGKIAKYPRGDNGFGFDVIFELSNGKTFAELSEKDKNLVSPRKIALEMLKKQLTNMV